MTAHVLVVYEASVSGRVALAHAESVARETQASLTVLSVIPHEPENVGCTRCRHNAAMWNRELRAIADEELAEASTLLGTSAVAEYRVARGDWTKAIAQTASRAAADLIVLPWRRSGRARRLFSRGALERLRQAGRWQVVLVPPDGHRADPADVRPRATA